MLATSVRVRPCAERCGLLSPCAFDANRAVLDFHADDGQDVLRELAFGTFDAHDAIADGRR